MSDEFENLFGGELGRSWALLGPKGSGKSAFAATIANGALKRKNFVVFSNMLLKAWASDDPKNPGGSGHWVEAYPEGYFKVTSFARFFELLPDVLEQRKQAILIIDEALIGIVGAGGAITQPQVRDAISVMALARKLRTCVILIAQAGELITSRLRGIGGGLLTGYLVKRPHAGYSIHEVVVFQTGSEKDGTRKEVVKKVELRGIGRPEEYAKEHPGAIVLDTMAAASFSIGDYRGTNMPFDLRRLLVEISDSLSDAVPGIIREHLQRGPQEVLPKPEVAGATEEEEKPDRDEPERPGPKGEPKPKSVSERSRGEIKAELLREFDKGAKPGVALAKRVQTDRAYTYEVYREWLQVGGKAR
jgi:hypothetical protein